MTPEHAIGSLKMKFLSANAVDVDRAVITREEWEALLFRLEPKEPVDLRDIYKD